MLRQVPRLAYEVAQGKRIFQEHRSFSAVVKCTSFPWQEPCRASVCSRPPCQPWSGAPLSSGVRAQRPGSVSAGAAPAQDGSAGQSPWCCRGWGLERGRELLVVPGAPRRRRRCCQPGARPSGPERERSRTVRGCEQAARRSAVCAEDARLPCWLNPHLHARPSLRPSGPVSHVGLWQPALDTGTTARLRLSALLFPSILN